MRAREATEPPRAPARTTVEDLESSSLDSDDDDEVGVEVGRPASDVVVVVVVEEEEEEMVLVEEAEVEGVVEADVKGDVEVVVEVELGVFFFSSPGLTSWSLSLRQQSTSRPPSVQVPHEYPNGQQESEPQAGKLTARAVVMRMAVGWRETSWSEMSQGIVAMLGQSALGQQRAVVLPARTRQVDEDGQQKSSGRDAEQAEGRDLGHDEEEEEDEEE